MRIVYDAWVAADAPEPRVVEVDGSTVDAAWHPLARRRVDGRCPTVPMVREALARHRPCQLQRLAAYALVAARRRRAARPATRSAGRTPGRGRLPGGGVDHGERPAVARGARGGGGDRADRRRSASCCGVHDEHFTGTAPHGREEDFHGVHLVFAATVGPGSPARARAPTGTTDAVAWTRWPTSRPGPSRWPRSSPPRSEMGPVVRFGP